jgi:hypothetical protein
MDKSTKKYSAGGGRLNGVAERHAPLPIPLHCRAPAADPAYAPAKAK